MNNDFYRADPNPIDPYVAFTGTGWQNIDLTVSVTPFCWAIGFDVMCSTLFVYIGPFSFSVGWYSR